MTSFAPDIKITDILGHHKFTLSAEVIPPRNGASPEEILKQISSLIDNGSQFLAVTKGAGGSLRGGSLPIAQLIKERFQRPCIAHFTCRDLTPEEVENQLVDHHYFGIRNILALRGDPPLNYPDWKPKENSHEFAYQLIQQIKNMNSGKYLDRPGFKTEDRVSTDFCIGVALYPDHPNAEERMRFTKTKVDAGASFGITQMLFSEKSYEDFLNLCHKNNIKIPILPGARILKSKAQAERMTKRFQCQISKDYYNSLPDNESPDTLNQSLEAFLVFVQKLKKIGAPGMHLFVLSDTDICSQSLRQMQNFKA